MEQRTQAQLKLERSKNMSGMEGILTFTDPLYKEIYACKFAEPVGYIQSVVKDSIVLDAINRLAYEIQLLKDKQ